MTDPSAIRPATGVSSAAPEHVEIVVHRGDVETRVRILTGQVRMIGPLADGTIVLVERAAPKDLEKRHG